MTTDDRPLFIQVSTATDLDKLRRLQLVGVNHYSKRKDATGAHLLRVGHKDESGAYSGHRYIVRCMSGQLFGEAHVMLRQKLGMPPLVVKLKDGPG